MNKAGNVVIVCGDRNWENSKRITWWLETIKPAVVIEGGARGADLWGRMAAKELDIDVITCPALWEVRGPSAGPRRNSFQLSVGIAMAAYLETSLSVAAFHNALSESKGTKDMVRQATRAKVDCVNIMETGAKLVDGLML